MKEADTKSPKLLKVCFESNFRKMNPEIMGECHRNIIEGNKREKWRWAGHVAREKDNRWSKR